MKREKKMTLGTSKKNDVSIKELKDAPEKAGKPIFLKSLLELCSKS